MTKIKGVTLNGKAITIGDCDYLQPPEFTPQEIEGKQPIKKGIKERYPDRKEKDGPVIQLTRKQIKEIEGGKMTYKSLLLATLRDCKIGKGYTLSEILKMIGDKSLTMKTLSALMAVMFKKLEAHGLIWREGRPYKYYITDSYLESSRYEIEIVLAEKEKNGKIKTPKKKSKPDERKPDVKTGAVDLNSIYDFFKKALEESLIEKTSLEKNTQDININININFSPIRLGLIRD